ncbi:MAG: hypothetical protein ABI168_11035 [Ginsengibacter sp.]
MLWPTRRVSRLKGNDKSFQCFIRDEGSALTYGVAIGVYKSIHDAVMKVMVLSDE